MSNFSPEDGLRLADAAEELAPIRAHQARQWVGSLTYLTEQIAASAGTSRDEHHSLMWLRLGGLLIELHPYCMAIREIDAERGTRNSRESRAVQAVLDGCAAVRNLFAEDELMWIQYRRDTEGHIWQDYYEVGVRNFARGTLRETRRFSILDDRDVRLEETQTRMRALLRAHGGTSREAERGIAIAFATRCWRQVEVVWRALGALEELRPVVDRIE